MDVNAQKWNAKPGSEGIVNASTLGAFENARLIRDTFFTAGDKLSFSMFIRPLSLTPTITEATTDIDGQVINYSHGFSQPTRIDWPGPKGGSYVRLTFRTGTGQIQSPVSTGPGPYSGCVRRQQSRAAFQRQARADDVDVFGGGRAQTGTALDDERFPTLVTGVARILVPESDVNTTVKR